MSADLRSLERDAQIVGLLEKLNRLDDGRAQQIADLSRLLANHIKRQDDELAELRDAVLALSNRLEAVTRTVGSGLHSVPSPRRVTRYCFECEHPRQFTEGKCDHCAAPLQPEAEPIG